MAGDAKYAIDTGKFVNRESGEEIPDDEPVFIFRARDMHAHNALAYYKTLCTNIDHQAAIKKQLDRFLDFAMDYPQRMKEPD